MGELEDRLNEFKSIAQEVFTWSTDSTASDTRPSQRERKRDFYEHLYVSRKNEQDLLNFLRGGHQIFVVTGHVGIGKSTLIRNQLENLKSCTGVIIDLNKHANEFVGKEFGKALEKRISESFHERILQNVLYCIRKKTELTVDVTYQDVEKIGERSDAEEYRNAEIELALHILDGNHVTRSPEVRTIRGEFGKNVVNGPTEERRKQLRKKIHEAGVDHATVKIFATMRYSDWVRLYQFLFDPQVPFLIVLDNTDAIDIRAIEGEIFQRVTQICDELNCHEDAKIAIGDCPKNVRFVYAVRDENVGLVRVQRVASRRISQVALGMDNYRVPCVPSVDEREELPTTTAFVSGIVRKRLQYLERHPEVDPELLKSLMSIMELWFRPNLEEGILSDAVANVDCMALNNSSIQRILGHIYDTCIDTLEACEADNISLNCLTERSVVPWLRGRIIRAVWRRLNLTKLSLRMKVDFRKKNGGPYISYVRLMLTWLARTWKEDPCRYTTPAELCDKMRRYFPSIELSTVKDILYVLYEGSAQQGELITMRQEGLIQGVEDIEDDADLWAMPRGVELLHRILIHVDFFGEMLPHDLDIPKRGKYPKILTEMAPSGALKYLSAIQNRLIKKMAASFKGTWLEQICPRMREAHQMGETEKYFDRFRDDMFIAHNRFYFLRVCDSHRLAIKQYLLMALWAGETAVGLPEEGLAEMRKEVRAIRATWVATTEAAWERMREAKQVEAPDAFYKVCFENAPRDLSLQKIWELHEEYSGLQREFEGYQKMERDDPRLDKETDA